jgi:hypothetical protein
MVDRMTKHEASSAWLLFVTNLPGTNKTLRMRIWRALKAAGAGALRDGVYVLPHSHRAQATFAEHASAIRAGGGSTHMFALQTESTDQTKTLIRLFDRTDEYQEINDRLEASKKGLATAVELHARRRLATLAREATALEAIDFFPGPSGLQLRSALVDAEVELNARFSPNEPKAAHQKIARLERKDYQGRTWATREHLWIDRVCSAWLIRRFIDRQAKFVWFKSSEDCPKRAVGFDFDGAQFTHVDTKVTFEVLLMSFGLESDSSLARLGALVHFLDVGGIPVPEAAGFAAIVSGTRALQSGDDALLKHVSPVLDGLYRSYASSERQGSQVHSKGIL